MAECDLCGKTADLMLALIEDTEFSVCKSCLSHGKRLVEEHPQNIPYVKQIKKEKPMSVFIEGFHLKVKSAREKLNLTQEELANKINEKLSIIHKLESGHFIPPMSLARKLENFLRIGIMQEVEEEKQEKKIDFKDSNLTIGDLINLKKKRI